jgi:hypothetical protein
MRGYGASTPMPRDLPWTLDVVIDGFVHLVDSACADAHRGRIAAHGAERVPALIEELETHAAEHWARRTMAGGLGDRFPPQGVAWRIEFMGRAPVSAVVGFNRTINYSDIRADVPRIACLTLVITTDESGLRRWTRRGRGSTRSPSPSSS